MGEIFEEHEGPFDQLLRTLGVRDQRIIELLKEVEDLHASAEFRSVIEQAKGVIMGATHCSSEAAFPLLVAQSQAENRKVRDIAAQLAEDQHRSAPAPDA